ncbi:MAG: RsmG family class I SAM-dependent methyltransferase [Rhodothermales bacterium]|nr:RsmG family class I SAM-dependent methyltransferase [Rhodothermales bacterium]
MTPRRQAPETRSPASVDPVDQLTPNARSQLERYVELLASFNRRVNLVSRESVDDLWVRHVVHSLYLGVRAFPPGSVVVDWGTGGGLPLIPLAVVCPDVQFVGVDSVEKKVLAVKTMAKRLGLMNVEVCACRAEQWKGSADYSVSRATAPLAALWSWHKRVARAGPEALDEGFWNRGLICLKGGDLRNEIDDMRLADPGLLVDVIPLDPSGYSGHFREKVIVAVSAT